MIKPDARLAIRRIPLESLQVREYEERYTERLIRYIALLKQYPGEYAGLISVVPSDRYKGLYVLLDGHHRLCAYIMTGRTHALCLVIEEE